MSLTAGKQLLLSSPAGGYQVSRSLRFNSADSANLSKTFASAGNQTTWTLSCWFKLCRPGSDFRVTPLFSGSSPWGGISIYQDKIRFAAYNGAYIVNLHTTQVFRDPSAWYHLVAVFDSNNGTSGDRARLYLNGSRITAFSTETYPSSGATTTINSTSQQYIGYEESNAVYSDCYFADYWFLDGIATDASSFGKTDVTTGQWIPKTYTGAKSGNSFHLEFADNSAATATTLGKDTSGNSNNWTPNNFSVLTGSSTVTTPATNAPPTIDFLVIAGGGGGTGGAFSGGGGAGGYRTSVGTSGGGASAESPLAVSPATTYPVIVGAGGALSANGSDSVFASITSKGGGRGGGSVSSQVGGSGGGGGPATIQPAGSAGTANQGFAGADGYATNSATPGGGGAGGAGSVASGSTGGAGGAGITSSITGTPVTRAAGGRGGDQNSNGVAGAANTGNGAQGHWNGTGAEGGSGIVILRYADTYADLIVGSGLTYTYANTGGYKIYSFTASVTPVQAAGNDSFVDTPTSYGTDTGLGGEVRGNYPVMNPLAKGANIVLSNGNLDITGAAPEDFDSAFATIQIPATGKWYFEFTVSAHTAGYTAPVMGVATSLTSLTQDYFVGGNNNEFGWDATGHSWLNGTQTNRGLPSYANDVMQLAVDTTNGKIWAGRNNTWAASGDPSAGTNPLVSSATFATTLFFALSSYQSQGAGSINFGQRSWVYAAPSGFKALCDTNLAAPVIAKPNTVMDVKLYTGNGSTQTISGLGFSPDFVWIKDRSQANGHGLFDVVRGATKGLFSNLTNAEITDSNSLTSFDSTGFSTGSGGTTFSTNINGNSYVGWCWDAGSTTTTNNSGSIQSSTRVNATAGFSIVTWTGTASAGTVGHGLGVAPEFIIVKNRSVADSWYCYHKSLGNAARIQLNETSAQTTGSSQWNSTSPTSTVYSVGAGSWQASGNLIVSYCFSPVAGYSSFGSYTGNGSADGPFVFCNFRPRWIMIKRTDAAYGWYMYDTARDTYNIAGKELLANASDAEVSDSDLDILSNGFKPRRSSLAFNASGGTFIYAAFAESPFAYSRAR